MVISEIVKLVNDENVQELEKYLDNEVLAKQVLLLKCVDYVHKDIIEHAIYRGLDKSLRCLVAAFKRFCHEHVGKRRYVAFALLWKRVEIAKFLLEEGFSPNVPYDISHNVPNNYAGSGFAAVIAARDYEDDEALRLLRCHNTDFNVVCEHYGNPIHAAIAVKNERQALRLLNYGIDIDGRDDKNNTALALAALYGFVYLCDALIEKGADVNALNSYGNNVLNCAVCNGNPNQEQIVDLLLKHGAVVDKSDVNFTNLLRFLGENIEMLRKFLDEGLITVDEKDCHGQTILFRAINSSLKAVKEVLKRNPKPVSDNDGWTPLLWAAYIYGINSCGDSCFDEDERKEKKQILQLIADWSGVTLTP